MASRGRARSVLSFTACAVSSPRWPSRASWSPNIWPGPTRVTVWSSNCVLPFVPARLLVLVDVQSADRLVHGIQDGGPVLSPQAYPAAHRQHPELIQNIFDKIAFLICDNLAIAPSSPGGDGAGVSSLDAMVEPWARC